MGAGIGFLSGLIGIGGGIFLMPVLLLIGRYDPHTTASLTGAFILVNSAAALGGHLSSTAFLPEYIWFYGLTVIIGGS